MSQLPSKFEMKPLYSVQREGVVSGVPPRETDGMEVAFFKAVEQFIRARSFRRLYIAAGIGSVVFAAWYLYKCLGSSDEEPTPPALPAPANLTTQCIQTATVHIDNNNESLVEAPPADEKVVVHCFARGYFTPCIATAPLQLETFLRVTNIPYEVNFCSELSGSDMPFMTLGTKAGNEFRECLEILGEKFDVDLERDASRSRQTASHLIDVMLENQFSWGILIWRYVFDGGRSVKRIQPLNPLAEEVYSDVAEQVKEATKHHPIGRLDKDDFVKMLFRGIQDMSAALGKHKYFLGETPGVVDCHAFAILAQLMWNLPGSPFEAQLRRYSNLVDYVSRMKENFWPDWSHLLTKPDDFGEMEMSEVNANLAGSPPLSGKAA